MRVSYKNTFGSRHRIVAIILTSLTVAPVLAVAQERAGLTHVGDRLAPDAGTLRSTVPDQELAAWVEERVERLQPLETERRIDQIGWAKDIRHALRLAREHDRPVFLFTHKGRINVGRC